MNEKISLADIVAAAEKSAAEWNSVNAKKKPVKKSGDRERGDDYDYPRSY